MAIIILKKNKDAIANYQIRFCEIQGILKFRIKKIRSYSILIKLRFRIKIKLSRRVSTKWPSSGFKTNN
ncbi:hypothetical protein BpHYR1_051436 [Brachionus plicatilis]|uniref:Uncharacterized protein n=1 Tax=Brachionus plicatilis TaxID=10195 RepID=A0A3M7SYY7_BRAPC|nr:hypothetical protein BpHYR1_051436 [Brachionus plicatilis]